MQSLQVRVYESLDDLQGLLPAWENLLSHSPTATIFSTWEWLAPWWRAFGNDQELMVLAFFDPHQTLAGLAPLSLSTHRVSRVLKFGFLRLVGDGSGDSDNLDLPVCAGYEEEFTRALLEYLDRTAGRWDLCQFNTLPAHSPAGNHLRKHLKQRGWTHFEYPRPWSVVVLPGSWESYLKQLSSKERGKLAYYSRRLGKNHEVRYYKCTQESELPTCLEALFQLHQARWQLQGQPGSFGSQHRRQFYSEMGRLFLARRWLEFWLLDLDGKTVAAQFGFRYSDTVFQLQEGFDPAYSADSIGYVLRGYVLKQLIADGVRRYDFLAGQSPDKARWGTQMGNYIDIHFGKPFSRGSVYLRWRHNARQSKEWLRAHLPHPIWRILHVLMSRLRGGVLTTENTKNTGKRNA